MKVVLIENPKLIAGLLQLTIVNINKRSYLQMCNVTKTLHILFFLLSFQAKMFIIKLVIYNALFCII